MSWTVDIGRAGEIAATMTLSVDRPDWNRFAVAAALHGISHVPEEPTGDVTEVALTGTLAKLQAVLNASGNGPRFWGLQRLAPRDDLRTPAAGGAKTHHDDTEGGCL